MEYNIDFTENAIEGIKKIKKSGDKQAFKKLDSLLNEIKTNPRVGTGKAEQLKHCEIETWSRRINDKHRIVYEIYDDEIRVLVISTFGHYKDK